MKILLGCLNCQGLGGSELFHYELAKELKLLENDVTLFTLRNIEKNDQVRKKLTKLNIRQIDITNIDINEKFDIIISSQPEVNLFFIEKFKNTPLISIIHSEIRSEDPVLSPRISHYVAIRQPIVDMLVEEYKIDKDKISLIYNPIDINKFKPQYITKKRLLKPTGLFVGEVLDNIRFKSISHLVKNCIENNWNLHIMSYSRYNFNHPNIKYINISFLMLFSLIISRQ